MPQIVPIRDLKNTTKISLLCHESDEPIFITKNGYGDMVIMSMESFEKAAFLNKVYGKLEDAELDVRHGKVSKACDIVSDLKAKYEL